MHQGKLDPETLTALATKAASGDERAFTEWVQLTYPLAFRAASSLLVSRADTEDALQETYARAWEKLPGLRQKETSVGWLLTLCRRISIDALRKRRPWDSLSEEETRQRALSLISKETPADQLLIEAQTRAILARALSLLPEAHREVIVLRELEGLSAPEISALLGVAVGTIESRTHRGKQALVQILERLGKR